MENCPPRPFFAHHTEQHPRRRTRSACFARIMAKAGKAPRLGILPPNNRTMKLYVGIDVSKDTLDVCIIDEQDKTVSDFKVRNEKSGFASIHKTIKCLSKGDAVRVCLESTGSYSFDVAHYLSRELSVSVANPLKVNRYAQAITRCKTDKVDARVIALYCRYVPFVPWNAPSAQAFELRSIMRQVAHLKKEITALRNRSHAANASCSGTSRVVNASCLKIIRSLSAECRLLAAKARELLRGDELLNRRYQQLRTIKGIADTSALAILSEIALFPEDISTAQAVALAGLDPRAGLCRREPR